MNYNFVNKKIHFVIFSQCEIYLYFFILGQVIDLNMALHNSLYAKLVQKIMSFYQNNS